MILLIALSILFFSLLLKFRDRLNYFKDQNVPYLKSIPILGALTDVILGRKSTFDNVLKMYNDPSLKDEPFFGFFLLYKPAIFIKDPELIKRILVTDFDKFTNRQWATGPKDPLYNNILTAKGQTWRAIRKNFSVFFSSGKLKNSFYIVEEMSNKLCEFINKRLDGGEICLNLDKICKFYTLDVGANLFYGIDPKSLEGLESEFQLAMHSAVEYTPKRQLCAFVSVFLPELYKYFDISFTSERFSSFTFNLVPKIIEERERSGQNRSDLIDLIIQLKNSDKNLSTDLLIAQAVSFLFGAYETSSTVISFTLYELAKHQNVQDKLREEILKKNEISFENIANAFERPYLHQVLNESMRLYSEIPFFDRVYEGDEDYSLKPFSDFKIPSGTPIWIPIYALSHDEKFFDDPWKFKPERFENIDENYAHMPFGIGPRSCIGKRFALLQVKTAIVKILKNFRVEMSEKTPKAIKIHKRATFIQAEEEIYVNFVKI